MPSPPTIRNASSQPLCRIAQTTSGGASSAPIEKVTVVAATRAEAFKELWRVLGPASSHRHWKGWVLGCKDARLVQEATDDR